MTAPQLAKDWLVTPNVRSVHVSLAAHTAAFFYQNKAALVAAGWTVWGSSDGATGDNTDRWASAADADTRGAAAANPQSWCVLENVDGVQLLFAFQGAGDNNGKLAYSPTGAYVLAGTGTHQPTAADESCFHAPGDSLVNSTNSLDRVFSIWCADDTTAWSCILFRNGATINILGFEKATSLCAPLIWGPFGAAEVPYWAYRFTSAHRDTGVIGNPVAGVPNVGVGATGFIGGCTQVFTVGSRRNCRVLGQIAIVSHTPGTAVGAGVAAPSLTTGATSAAQGGDTLLMPLPLLGERAANVDGVLGTAIDWLQAVTASQTSPATGDFFPGFDPDDVPGVSGGQTGVGDVRTNWLVALGAGMVRPWRNAAASLIAV